MNNATRQSITNLFAAFSGQQNTLTIPRPYIALCGGDILAALLLSQCVYWADRTQDDDGWFAKSYSDWQDELGMTQYQITRAAKLLADIGLETKLKKFNGAPTVHYRINMDVFSQSIMKFLDNPISSNSTIDHEETSQSLTKTTTKTTAEEKEAAVPEAENEKSPRPQNAMFDAVSWAWRNTSGGYVGKLIAFLTGKCKPKDGKYHTHMICEPMTPLEVVAFRLWRDYHELDMPKLPETIERLVEEFRGVPEYDRLLEAAAQHEIRHAPRQANEVTEGNAAPEFDTPDVPVVRDVNSVLDGVLAQLGGG
jgi:hypothetical protein